MVPTTKVDNNVLPRATVVTPVKRILQLLMATSPPAPKAQVKRPSYLRYIEYV